MKRDLQSRLRKAKRLTLFVKLKSSQSSVVTTSNSRSTPVPSVVTEIQDMRVVVVENQAISTGLTPPQPTLKPHDEKREWKRSFRSKVFYHDDGYFLVRFNSNEDMDEVFLTGPYTLRNRPIIMKLWTDDFDFHAEILQTIPIWVRLPNLPLNSWGMDSLSRIESGLGVPLYLTIVPR
ncbi:hypothetical protein MTR67_040205 [Solanum verrucosum]|uniref:DUF4283 domain-containing protein n=1 Tax=Solanum verrucosum TaxID=315347 RepID=A0AAF0ZRG2_SOLVR|nr:hypothetical protein MTR67_040205 [Solanum verrucosum]